MHILASSVADIAGTFLHAGYISAAQTSHGLFSCMAADAGSYDTNTLHERAVSAAAPAASMVTDGASVFALIAGVACLVLGVAAVYLFRRYRSRSERAPG